MKKTYNTKKDNAHIASEMVSEIIEKAKKWGVDVWTIYYEEYSGIDEHSGFLQVESLIISALQNMRGVLIIQGIW